MSSTHKQEQCDAVLQIDRNSIAHMLHTIVHRTEWQPMIDSVAPGSHAHLHRRSHCKIMPRHTDSWLGQVVELVQLERVGEKPAELEAFRVLGCTTGAMRAVTFKCTSMCMQGIAIPA